MTTADITIAFTCADEDMVRERIESVHFDRRGMTYEIMSVEPGSIPDGEDECDLPDYRWIHGLAPVSSRPAWSSHIPEGCTAYVAHVRLQDAEGAAMTRERILEIPFGDRDLSFSIDRIEETC